MLSNNSEYHSYLFTHFCPLGDKRMAITIEKRTVKVPKKTNAFILYPPLFIIKRSILSALEFLFFFILQVKEQSSTKKPYANEATNKIKQPMLLL